MSHTIIVARDEYGEHNWTYGGTHDDSCRVWTPCIKDWHRHPQNDYGQYGYNEWSTKRVIELHRYIDGEWMTLTDECALIYADENDAPLGIDEPGTYEIDVEWDGDYWTVALGERVKEGAE